MWSELLRILQVSLNDLHGIFADIGIGGRDIDGVQTDLLRCKYGHLKPSGMQRIPTGYMQGA